MPDLGPMGRGGARRRTRRRMMAMNEMQKSPEQQEQKGDQPDEIIATDVYSEKLEKLAKLLKEKGVITEEEYDSIFG